ncbi:MAG: cytochrome b [Pseudomonadota bacterium]
MGTKNVTGYTALQLILHWLIAVFVILQLVFGETIGKVVDAGARDTMPTSADRFLADLHYWVGIAVLALMALRLWLRASRGAPPVAQGGWVGLAGRVSHATFYIVLILMPVSGLLAFYLGGLFGEAHELGKPALIVLISLHAVAALYHQFWLKDGTLRRILVPRR